MLKRILWGKDRIGRADMDTMKDEMNMNKGEKKMRNNTGDKEEGVKNVEVGEEVRVRNEERKGRQARQRQDQVKRHQEQGHQGHHLERQEVQREGQPENGEQGNTIK